jgi:hypothetical protein
MFSLQLLSFALPFFILSQLEQESIPHHNESHASHMISSGNEEQPQSFTEKAVVLLLYCLLKNQVVSGKMVKIRFPNPT